MIFTPYSIATMLWPEKLGLERAKDMTRRPAKDNECCLALIDELSRWLIVVVQHFQDISVLDVREVCIGEPGHEQIKWRIGRDYAIQPGRGQKQVGRFYLASIAWEPDVRQMTEEDVAREGFHSLGDFLEAWKDFYGESFGPPLGVWVLTMADVDIDEGGLPLSVWKALGVMT